MEETKKEVAEEVLPIRPAGKGIVIKSPDVDKRMVDDLMEEDNEPVDRGDLEKFTVLAVGPECTSTKEGDEIIFRNNAMPIVVCGGKYCIFQEYEIVAYYN